MIEQLNVLIGRLNQWSDVFWRFSTAMFIQVTVLVLVLWCLELLLKQRVRAITRYCVWMLVLAKLLLPVQLGTPVSVGYWLASPVALTSENEVKTSSIAVGRDEPTATVAAAADIPLHLHEAAASEAAAGSRAYNGPPACHG